MLASLGKTQRLNIFKLVKRNEARTSGMKAITYSLKGLISLQLATSTTPLAVNDNKKKDSRIFLKAAELPKAP